MSLFLLSAPLYWLSRQGCKAEVFCPQKAYNLSELIQNETSPHSEIFFVRPSVAHKTLSVLFHNNMLFLH